MLVSCVLFIVLVKIARILGSNFTATELPVLVSCSKKKVRGDFFGDLIGDNNKTGVGEKLIGGVTKVSSMSVG